MQRRNVEVQKSSPLAPLAPIMLKWFRVIDDYQRATLDVGDVPYWYNERASLSTLAAAIWKSGGVALEEYKTTKTRGGPKKGKYEGRADLWFTWKGKDYVGEAKHVEFAMQRRSTAEDTYARTQRALKSAKKSVRLCPGAEGRRLEVVFVTPSVRKAYWDHGPTRAALLDAFHRGLERTDPCLLAWTRPRPTPFVKYDGKTWYYPIAAVVVRMLKRQ